MRDPTTDLVVKELTELAIQYLCERELLELNEAINRNFAISESFLKRPRPWGWRPPARKRGRPSKRELHLQIAGAVAMLVEDYGCRPTRSHAKCWHRATSACSIVTVALEQKREALERWANRLRDIVTPPPANVRRLHTVAADA